MYLSSRLDGLHLLHYSYGDPVVCVTGQQGMYSSANLLLLAFVLILRFYILITMSGLFLCGLYRVVFKLITYNKMCGFYQFYLEMREVKNSVFEFSFFLFGSWIFCFLILNKYWELFIYKVGPQEKTPLLLLALIVFVYTIK